MNSEEQEFAIATLLYILVVLTLTPALVYFTASHHLLAGFITCDILAAASVPFFFATIFLGRALKHHKIRGAGNR